MTSRTVTTPALVIKRVNTGEADRIVTLLTKDHGKLVTAAKGVRKMTSSKRAFLEPGNLIKAYLIKTKSLPLLTQATLLENHPHCKNSLVAMRQLTQVLEVIDRLFAEENPEPELYDLVLDIIYDLNQPQPHLGQIKHQLSTLIGQFGFLELQGNNSGQSLLELVADITEKPMRSWEYLSVGSE